MQWLILWTVFFTLLIFGVVFVTFAISGQVPWGSCPDATRAPDSDVWAPDYRNDSETGLCSASTVQRVGCGIGGLGMLLVAAGILRHHAVNEE